MLVFVAKSLAAIASGFLCGSSDVTMLVFIIGLFVSSVGFENAAHRSRNHQMFVRSNEAHRDAAGDGRDHSRRARIAQFTEREAEEARPSQMRAKNRGDPEELQRRYKLASAGRTVG